MRPLNAAMEAQNVYYQDLIQGNVLRPLVVTDVAKNGFQTYMKSIGKLGGKQSSALVKRQKNC